MGIDNNTPVNLYTKSLKPFPASLPEITYSGSYDQKTLSNRGILHYAGREIAISRVLRNQPVGLYLVDDNILMVRFMNIVLGHIDDKELKFSPMREFVKAYV